MNGRSQQLTLGALAALGSLVIHQLAYLAAYPVEATRAAQLADHGHMSAQFALVTPVAVVAAACFILRQVQGLGLGRRLSARRLTMASSGLFLAQEAIEATVRGDAPWSIVAHPAIVLGLALAPLVALGFRRMLEVVEHAVRRLRPPSSLVAVPRVAVLRPRSDRPLTARFLPAGPTRGPPLVRC
ncbi:MAG: hypothetical protein AAFN30_08715 [Actinomycetota bacterium]